MTREELLALKIKPINKKIEKEVKEKNNTKLIVDSVKNIIINGKQ